MNRAEVLAWAKRTYGTEPEHLWACAPGYAVLRNPSGKWYAVVMDVPREKLGMQGKETVDVLDVKCGPVLVGSLRLQAGFLPAYHMNKNSWISILLDGTVPSTEIESLLALSYTLSGPKRGSGGRQDA